MSVTPGHLVQDVGAREGRGEVGPARQSGTSGVVSPGQSWPVLARFNDSQQVSLHGVVLSENVEQPPLFSANRGISDGGDH